MKLEILGFSTTMVNYTCYIRRSDKVNSLPRYLHDPTHTTLDIRGNIYLFIEEFCVYNALGVIVHYINLYFTVHLHCN